jgi:hypothetical protein
VIAILVACLLSSVLYRLGGVGKPFNTKFRDLGCPTVLVALCWILFGFHWVYIPMFGLCFGALTTYWDFLFGYDNFWMHGFMCALPTALLCWFIPWWIPVIHIIICTVGMGLWSKIISWDVAEEAGRGAFFIL